METESHSFKREIAQIIGWILALIVPLFVFYFLPTIHSASIRDEPRLFLSILSATSIMWIFSLVPEFVTCIFSVLAVLFLSLAEPSTALSGFASSTFIVILGIFSMATAIEESGILKRMLLGFLRKQTASHHVISWKIWMFGLFLTPLVPSIISRCKLLGHLTSEISQTLSLNSKERTSLYNSAFAGSTLLSASFLTASLFNFVVLAYIPLQEQYQFQNVGWFVCNIFLSLGLILTHIVIHMSFFGWGKSSYNLDKTIKTIYEKLPPIGSNQIFAVFFSALFFIGILTSQYHKIPQSYLALGIFFLLISFQFFSQKDFEDKTEWSVLFYFAAVVSIVQIGSSLEIDIFLYQKLNQFFPNIFTNKIYLIGVLSCLVCIMRLILPVGVVCGIVLPITLVLGQKIGMNVWPLCLTLVFMGDIWFFPYQVAYYRLYRVYFETGNVNERHFLIANTLFNLMKLVVFGLNIYYWKFLKII